ncbi:MAG TPA: amidase [Bryobacteraceae bacterium]|nr:amidase [Bryobacteraceae bacterium]
MADIDDSVFFASAAEINRRLKAREFSAVELTRKFCDRMERFGPRFAALALDLRDSAIRQARDVDDDLKRERFRGPLQGVPWGAKDLLSVSGQITTWGAKPFAAQVFDHDATAVSRLARTGAILTSKLSMIELAGGGGYRYPAASLFQAGRNPWNTSRWAGGRSSGSGSAVAAGLVTFALGSETSGSILTPAAYCGITGLRPTYGLVSRFGAMPLSWTLDKIGPMCHTAEDCGLVLQAIAGKDEKDPGSAGKSFYFVPRYHRDIKTVRIAYSPVDFEGWLPENLRPVFQQALQTLKGLGAQLREIPGLPDFPYTPAVTTVIGAESSSVFEELIESGRVNELADEKQIAGLKASMDIGARDYLKAMRIRRLIQAEFRNLLTDIDVLLSPTRFTVATGIQEPLDAPSPPAAPDVRGGMRSLIPASNLAGLPALSLPCGFVDGLPLAIQLVSRPFTENLLLSVGMQFQNATDWHKRRPKVG